MYPKPRKKPCGAEKRALRGKMKVFPGARPRSVASVCRGRGRARSARDSFFLIMPNPFPPSVRTRPGRGGKYLPSRITPPETCRKRAVSAGAGAWPGWLAGPAGRNCPIQSRGNSEKPRIGTAPTESRGNSGVPRNRNCPYRSRGNSGVARNRTTDLLAAARRLPLMQTGICLLRWRDRAPKEPTTEACLLLHRPELGTGLADDPQARGWTRGRPTTISR